MTPDLPRSLRHRANGSGTIQPISFDVGPFIVMHGGAGLYLSRALDVERVGGETMFGSVMDTARARIRFLPILIRRMRP